MSKIASMEKKYNKQFQIVFEVITQLLENDKEPKRKIGYAGVSKAFSGKTRKK